MLKSLFSIVFLFSLQSYAAPTTTVVFQGQVIEHLISGEPRAHNNLGSCILTLRLKASEGEGIRSTRGNQGHSWSLLRPELISARLELPQVVQGRISYRPYRGRLSAIYMYEGGLDQYTALVSHSQAPFNLTFDFSAEQDSPLYPILPLTLDLVVENHNFQCSNFQKE